MYVCVYIYVCMYVCVCMYMCVCMCVYIYTSVCVYVCVFMYVYVCVCVYIYMCVCVDDLEVLILLPPAPQCWSYCEQHHTLFYVGLGLEPRASCMLGKQSMEDYKILGQLSFLSGI